MSSEVRSFWCRLICIASVLACGSVFVCSVCSGSDTGGHHNYVISYLWRSLAEELNADSGALRVTCIDTHSDSTWRSNDPYSNDIRYFWCDEWDTTVHATGARPKPLVNWNSVPEIGALLYEASHIVNSGDPGYVIAGTGRSCVPELGLRGIDGYIYKGGSTNHPTTRFEFWCVYNDNTGEVTFVDAMLLPEDFNRRNRQIPFFDVRHQYLYYRASQVGKRFNLVTHRIDTLPYGETPIIPWNFPAIVVWDARKELYSLLDDSLHVKGSQISAELKGEVTSAFALSDSTVLIGVCFNRGTDWDVQTVVYELDFKAGVMTEIAGRLPLSLQIVGARPIE
jgi:hypothetical protein